MNHRTALAIFGLASSLVLLAFPASANLTSGVAAGYIDNKADTYPAGFLGTAGALTAGVSGCSGSCLGWFKPYGTTQRIYSWGDPGRRIPTSSKARSSTSGIPPRRGRSTGGSAASGWGSGGTRSVLGYPTANSDFFITVEKPDLVAGLKPMEWDSYYVG